MEDGRVMNGSSPAQASCGRQRGRPTRSWSGKWHGAREGAGRRRRWWRGQGGSRRLRGALLQRRAEAAAASHHSSLVSEPIVLPQLASRRAASIDGGLKRVAGHGCRPSFRRAQDCQEEPWPSPHGGLLDGG